MIKPAVYQTNQLEYEDCFGKVVLILSLSKIKIYEIFQQIMLFHILIFKFIDKFSFAAVVF